VGTSLNNQTNRSKTVKTSVRSKTFENIFVVLLSDKDTVSFAITEQSVRMREDSTNSKAFNVRFPDPATIFSSVNQCTTK